MQMPKLIRLPSTDASGQFDRHVLLPAGTDVELALRDINDIVQSVHREDENFAGECLDGKSIEENIERRVNEMGFMLFQSAGTASEWDSFNTKHGQDLKHSFAMRAECEVDVNRFRSLLRQASPDAVLFSLPHTNGFPDRVIDLRTNLSKEEVVDILERVPDGHTMVRTLESCPLPNRKMIATDEVLSLGERFRG